MQHNKMCPICLKDSINNISTKLSKLEDNLWKLGNTYPHEEYIFEYLRRQIQLLLLYTTKELQKIDKKKGGDKK